MKSYIIFIDESGDHGLVNINQDFPVFILCGLLTESENYEKTRKDVNDLKNKFWNGKKVIFHSRDIRKCEKEFVLLFDLEVKKAFYEEVNKIINENQFTIFASVIDKNKYVLKHGRLGNDVYEISLSFLVEECLKMLLECSDEPFELKILIEKRGRKEDQTLAEHFQKIIARGTGLLGAGVFEKNFINIEFKNKKEDINGLQLADLAAYPIARFILDKNRANPAFDIIKEKIHQKDGNLTGLRIYP